MNVTNKHALVRGGDGSLDALILAPEPIEFEQDQRKRQLKAQQKLMNSMRTGLSVWQKVLIMIISLVGVFIVGSTVIWYYRYYINRLGTLSGLTATSTTNSVTAQWYPCINASFYTLVWQGADGTLHTVNNIRNTTYTITGLTSGSFYGVAVVAVNAATQFQSNQLQVGIITFTEGTTPVSLTATGDVSRNTIAVSWQPGATFVTSKNYNNVTSSDSVQPATGIITWRVNNVESFDVGDSVVIAFAGNSADNLVADISAVDSINHRVTANVSQVNGLSNATLSPWSFTLISAALDQGTYTVELISTSDPSNVQTNRGVVDNTTVFQNVACGETYSISIVSFSDTGNMSPAASITTHLACQPLLPTRLFAAPNNNGGVNTIQVSWYPNTNDVSYTVTLSDENSNSWTLNNITGYVINFGNDVTQRLICNTLYTITLQAFGSSPDLLSTTTQTLTTSIPCTALPPAPVDLKAQYVLNSVQSEYDLEWTGIGSATSFICEYFDDEDELQVFTLSNPGVEDSRVAAPTMLPNHLYTIRLAAVVSGVQSAWITIVVYATYDSGSSSMT